MRAMLGVCVCLLLFYHITEESLTLYIYIAILKIHAISHQLPILIRVIIY